MDIIPIQFIHYDYDVTKLREILSNKSCADLKKLLRVFSYDPPILNKTNMIEFVIKKLLHEQRKQRKRHPFEHSEESERHVKFADPEREQIEKLDIANAKLQVQMAAASSRWVCETAAGVFEDSLRNCPIGYYLNMQTTCCKLPEAVLSRTLC